MERGADVSTRGLRFAGGGDEERGGKTLVHDIRRKIGEKKGAWGAKPQLL